MDCKKIAVIGRNLNNPKWATLFDILNQGVSEGLILYDKYEIDKLNTNTNMSEFDYHIYLATKPLINDESKYIRFTSSATENDILIGMQAFAEKIFSEELKILNDSDDEDSLNIKIEDINDIESHIIDIDNSILKLESNNDIKELIGVTFEINDKEIIINKDDAFKLKELIELIDKVGYKIKDVVTG